MKGKKRRKSFGRFKLMGLLLGCVCAPVFADIVPNNVWILLEDGTFQGQVPPSTGDLTLGDSDELHIADLGDLLVNGGSVIRTGNVGTAVGTTSAIITGTGTRIEAVGVNTDRLLLRGIDTFSILDGAVFEASDPTGCPFSACNIRVGGFSGADSTLTISGTGSTLNYTSALIVGSAVVNGTPLTDATGTLLIENGGVVTGDRASFADGTFGDNSGTILSRAFVTVRDAGSVLNTTDLIMGNDQGDFDGGVAVFNIENSGTVNVATAIVAGLGFDTDATINLNTGGTLNAQAIYAGRAAGASGVLNITDPGTSLNLGDELIIGQGSIGDLNVTNGASINIGGGGEIGFIGSGLVIGTQGGTGTAVFNNANVVVGRNNDLAEVRFSVGLIGTGSAVIENGTSLLVEDLSGILGQVGDGISVGVSSPGLPADGQLTIQGAGTNVTVNTADLGFLIVGVAPNGVDSAVGVLDILDGATVSITGTGFNSGINLGRGATSNGTMNVSGAGTFVDVLGPQGVIAVAADYFNAIGDGEALFTVTDQARVNLAGLTPGQGFFQVGNGTGNGTLLVNTGGIIDIDGFLNVSIATADNDTQTGLVTVDDTGVINVLDIFVGNRGVIDGDGTINANNLTVFAGGVVDLESLAGIRNVLLDGGTYNAPAGLFTIAGSADQSITLQNGGQVITPGGVQLGGGTGSGSIAVTGAGSLFSAQGDVSLNGSLIADTSGAFTTSGAVFVGPGGLIGGNGGQLTATNFDIQTGGIIAAGNSPGTLNLTGDLNLMGGELQIEIAGSAPGEYDVINVDGAINLIDGSVSVALLNGYSPSGASIDVLTATNGINQSPGVAFVYNGTGPDFEFNVRDAGGVDIGSIDFLAIDLTTLPDLAPEQLSMATYIDDLCPRVELLADATAAEQDLDLRCGDLRSGGRPFADVEAALSALTPDEVIGTFSHLLRFTNIHHGNLSRRLNGLRSGAARVNLRGLNIETDSASVSGEELQEVVEALTDDQFDRWGFFSDGRINFGDRQQTSLTPGFDFQTTSLTLGTDYRVAKSFFVGAALGFNEVNADFDVGGGVLMRSTTLSFLATYFKGDSFYVDAMATYGHSSIDTSRHINYNESTGALRRKAKGDTDGQQWVWGLGSGFDFTHNRWVFGPHLGVNYADIGVDSFDEEGALGLNLAFPDVDTETFTANAGVHVSYTLTPRWGVLVPYARLDYVREFEDNSTSSQVRFAHDRFSNDPLDPTRPASVVADGADSSYVVWSVGLHAQMTHGIAAFLDYRGTEGLDEFDLSEVSLGLRYEKSF